MSQKKITEWAWCHIKSHQTYIDVGAGWGDTAEPFVNHFDEIHCFEPNTHYQKITHPKITWHHVALGDCEAEIELHMPAESDNFEHGSTSYHRIKQWQNTKLIGTCPMTTLDSYHFQSVDFIKIDVEQGEWSVIQGAQQTIAHNKPTIMYENKRHENDHVNEWLHTQGYEIHRHKSDCVAVYH